MKKAAEKGLFWDVRKRNKIKLNRGGKVNLKSITSCIVVRFFLSYLEEDFWVSNWGYIAVMRENTRLGFITTRSTELFLVLFRGKYG